MGLNGIQFSLDSVSKFVGKNLSWKPNVSVAKQLTSLLPTPPLGPQPLHRLIAQLLQQWGETWKPRWRDQENQSPVSPGSVQQDFCVCHLRCSEFLWQAMQEAKFTKAKGRGRRPCHRKQRHHSPGLREESGPRDPGDTWCTLLWTKDPEHWARWDLVGPTRRGRRCCVSWWR